MANMVGARFIRTRSSAVVHFEGRLTQVVKRVDLISKRLRNKKECGVIGF